MQQKTPTQCLEPPNSDEFCSFLFVMWTRIPVHNTRHTSVTIVKNVPLVTTRYDKSPQTGINKLITHQCNAPFHAFSFAAASADWIAELSFNQCGTGTVGSGWLRNLLHAEAFKIVVLCHCFRTHLHPEKALENVALALEPLWPPHLLPRLYNFADD